MDGARRGDNFFIHVIYEVTAAAVEGYTVSVDVYSTVHFAADTVGVTSLK